MSVTAISQVRQVTVINRTAPVNLVAPRFPQTFQGPRGFTGEPGAGVPTGGATNDLLHKTSGADRETAFSSAQSLGLARVGANEDVTGSWTFTQHVAWHNTPERFGAVGDGVADDTQAVWDWLSAGGGACYDGKKTYLIDPMRRSGLTVNVWCAPGVTFKQRRSFTTCKIANNGNAGDFADLWGQRTGIIELRDGVTRWYGGLFDQDRDNPAIQTGLAGVIGTDETNQVKNQYKAGLYIRALSGSRETHLDALEMVNCFNYGLVAESTAQGASVTGSCSSVRVLRSGGVARFDRCSDFEIGSVFGASIDNRIGQDNDVYFPAFYHAVHLIRCVNAPVNTINLFNLTGRPGEHFATPGTEFMNVVTRSACTACPIDSMTIRGFRLSLETSSDSGGAPVASFTSALGFSDVSCFSSPVAQMFIEGTFTQGWELITHEDSDYGLVKILGTQGRQVVQGTGSWGVNIHGEARPDEEVSSGRFKRNPQVTINSLEVSGFHLGCLQRKCAVHVHHANIYNNRLDGWRVDHLGDAEYPGESTPPRPSAYFYDPVIRFNGGHGIRNVNGAEVIAYGGRISDNCQMASYADPTITVGNQLGAITHGVLYDSGNANAGAVDRIWMIGVDTQSVAAFDVSDAIGYIPGTPTVGTNDTIPDNRVSVFPVIFKNPNSVHIGQRLTFKGVAADDTTDVRGWIRQWYGDIALVEIHESDKATAWAEGSKSLVDLDTGWTVNAARTRITNGSGTLLTDLSGPAALKIGTSGWAFMMNMLSNTQAVLYTEVPFIPDLADELTGAPSNVQIEALYAGLAHTVSQTADFSITNANVTSAKAVPIYGRADVAEFAGLRVTGGPLGLGANQLTTIAADTIAYLHAYMRVNTEGNAATDDLHTITGGSDGDLLLIRANTSDRTVVVKNRVGTTGNIRLRAAQTFTMDQSSDRLLLQFDAALNVWIELSRSNIQEDTSTAIANVPTGGSATASANATAINAILAVMRAQGIIPN
jgi:hypothetical protein